MNALIQRAGLLALAAILTACHGGTGKVYYMKEKAPLPNFVAVLPPDNESNDMAAADTVRRVASEMLLGLGMLPVTTAGDDEILRKLGITDGGQLRSVPPQKLAKALGVDGLLYSTVKTFNEVNIVVYFQRIVAAQMKLLDKDGNKIWEILGKGFNRQVNVSPSSMIQEAAKVAVAKVITSQLEKMLNIHLLQEAQQMTAGMTPKLPQWPEVDKPGVDIVAAQKAKAEAKAKAKADRDKAKADKAKAAGGK